MSGPEEAPRGDLSRVRNGGVPWRHVLDTGEPGTTHAPFPAAPPPAAPPPAMSPPMTSPRTTSAPVTEIARPEPDGQAASLITALIWYWRLVLLVILGATVLGGTAGVMLQPPPTAVAQIAVLDPRGNSVLRQGVTSEASFQTYTAQRAIFAASTEVLTQACDRLREQGLLCSAAALKAQVKTSVSDSGAMIDISASADTGTDAVKIADAVVAAYRNLTSKDLQAQVAAQQQAVNSAIGSLTKTVPEGLPGSVTNNAAASTMSQLQARAANAAVDASSALDGTRFVVAAQLVPNRWLNAIGRGAGTGAGAGFLVAVILGYALADRVPATHGGRRHAVRRAQRAQARLAAWEREHPIPGPDRSPDEWPPQETGTQPRPAVAEPLSVVAEPLPAVAEPHPAVATRRSALASGGARAAAPGPGSDSASAVARSPRRAATAGRVPPTGSEIDEPLAPARSRSAPAERERFRDLMDDLLSDFPGDPLPDPIRDPFRDPLRDSLPDPLRDPLPDPVRDPLPAPRPDPVPDLLRKLPADPVPEPDRHRPAAQRGGTPDRDLPGRESATRPRESGEGDS